MGLDCNAAVTNNTRRAAKQSLAAIIAALSWLTLWKHVREATQTYGTLHGLWFMVGFYSHWLNAMIAVVFTILSLKTHQVISVSLMSKLVILIGILWAVLLVVLGWSEGFQHSTLRLKIQHGFVPLLVLIYWFFFVPRGRLRASDPLVWTIMPIAYTAYVLTWGAFTGEYTYPLANPRQFGYHKVLAEIALTTILTVLAGYLLLLIDRVMLSLSFRLNRPRVRV